MLMKNSLPTMIVDKLAQFGLIRLPLMPNRIAIESKPDKILAKNLAKVNAPPTYDPDVEFIEAAQRAPRLFDFTSDTDPEGRPIALYSAQLYETNGKAYRLRKVTGTKEQLLEALDHASKTFTESFGDELLPAYQLREAKTYDREQYLEALAHDLLEECVTHLREGHTFETVVKSLRESNVREGDGFAYGGGYGSGEGSFQRDWFTRNNYGDGRDANSEYTPLLGGPWNKQLYLSQYLDMHAKAFEAYNHNPIAHQLIRLATMFTLGRGLDHTSSNVEIDELIREFVDRTDFYERLEVMANDLWWAGELFIEFYDGKPSKGLTDFRTMDPSTVWEIITQPDDFRNVYYLHQQYSTPYQNYIDPNIKNSPAAMKYIIRQVPAQDFYHVKINSSEYEKRGRSELFSVLGWVKRYKDLMNSRVIKGQLEAAFVWDIEIASGDAEVETIGLQLPDPYNPGATFIHNKALKLTPQASAIRASEAAPDIAELKSVIATGASTPKEFIGETSKGSRGNSLAGTEPGTKNYESKQQIEMRIVYAVFDRVIQNAADAGLIDLDEVLQDARTVKRLQVVDDTLDNRDDVQKEFEQNKDEQEQQKQQQMDAQNAALAQGAASAAPMVGVNKSQPLGGSSQLALPGGGANGAPPAAQPPGMVNVKARETLVKTGPTKKMSDRQNRRIKAIKASGKYARELIELSFPSIAQEDRSAKLKDLALAEAMEWLPKSVVATLAAKELNITTYDFQEAWAMIVDEAKKGMSIAHVFGQDNKHVPDVAMAQSVQEEDEAMQPAAQTFTNVPVPPAVAGMKQVPNAPGGAPGGGNVPPGSKPNSGDTKVNNKAAIPPPNPTAASPKNSDAGKSPFTNEGIANRQKEAAVLQRAIYTVLLKEAMKPMIDMRTSLARYVLTNDAAKEQFEQAVAETEKMRTNAPDGE
jgi:hypothetical protein